MTDQDQKAFDFAQDATKQLITLSTGVVAITITFFKDFAANAPSDAKTWMQWSWVVYVASIVFGVWTLLALTGALGAGDPSAGGSGDTRNKSDADKGRPSIYSPAITLPAVLQALTFLAALVMSVVAGWKAVT